MAIKQVALDAQHTEQIRVLERDMQGLNSRFDRHLEIYAQNGKELTAVKAELRDARADIARLAEGVAAIPTLMEDKYLTKTENAPQKALVYGAVALMLTALVGQWITSSLTSSQQLTEADVQAAVIEALVEKEVTP